MAADQLTDKEDQFKRRARRRLVGAVALVLLMVTVLPMILDDRSNQKSPRPEIAISIPSQDGTDFTSKIVPVAPQPAAPAPAPVAIASAVEKPAAPPVAAKPAPKPVETKPAAPVAEPPAKPHKENTPEPAEKTPPAKPEATKPAPAEAKAKPTTTSPTIKKGSFSVQIGVFSDLAKVKQMHAKIAEKGIQCYTENLDTPKGVKYRVRCGPYAEKPAAQQSLETLKASGYNGILVTNQ